MDFWISAAIWVAGALVWAKRRVNIEMVRPIVFGPFIIRPRKKTVVRLSEEPPDR